MHRHRIACRPHSYGPFAEVAFAHLASLGIGHVEIDVPPADQLSAVVDELQRHGLQASSLQGECDLSRADVRDQVAAQMPAFAALNSAIMFVSVKAGDTPPDVAIGRLREAGEVVAAHGVTLALETHPDLATNATVARATLEAVNHPNVRLNFDTANVYFYNHDVDGVDELQRVVEFVAAVHLKDTDGGYRHWHFPALGRGIVDFRRVFEVLDVAGFAGPCTLEIEGLDQEVKTERLVCERIAESAGYLRGLGRL